MPSAKAAPSHLLADPDMDLTEAKRLARAEAKRRRDRAAALAADAAEAVSRRILDEVPIPGDAVVAGYWPIQSELDTRPLLHRLHESGRRCVLPVAQARGQALRFRLWSPGDALVPGLFGVPEPSDAMPELDPTVLLVPLLAFDRQGGRLGYGAGFYDRTLERLRAKGPVLAVGVAYAGQEMETVPRDRHDQPIDWLVTEAFAERMDKPK